MIKSSKSVFVMEEQLIEYVRGYDHLFNPQNKDYRDLKARREAWEEISERLGISGKSTLYLFYLLNTIYKEYSSVAVSNSFLSSSILISFARLFVEKFIFLKVTIIHR